MYAKELFVSGEEDDFKEAANIFEQTLKQPGVSVDMQREAICVLCHTYRVTGNTDRFFSLAFKLMPDAVCSELCYEVGSYFKDQEDYEEAVQWFELAAYQAEPVIDVRAGGILPLLELGECCRALSRRIGGGNQEHEGQVQFYLEAAEKYEKEAAGWDMPDN